MRKACFLSPLLGLQSVDNEVNFNTVVRFWLLLRAYPNTT